jgi:hypothetical protein
LNDIAEKESRFFRFKYEEGFNMKYVSKVRAMAVMTAVFWLLGTEVYAAANCVDASGRDITVTVSGPEYVGVGQKECEYELEMTLEDGTPATISTDAKYTWTIPSDFVRTDDATIEDGKITLTAPAKASSSSTDKKTISCSFSDTDWDDEGCEEEIKVTIVKVDIKCDSTVITGKTQDCGVGQPVNLEGTVAPSGLTLSSKKWTIPGVRVKGYTANSSSAKVDSVEDADLKAASIKYYWADGCNSRVVKYVVIIGGCSLEGKTTFNVKCPVVAGYEQNGSVKISDLGGGVGLEVHYGDGTAMGAGVLLGGMLTCANGYGGSQCWVQIAHPLRRMKRNDGTWRSYSGDGVDKAFPYTNSNFMSDSPGNGLTNAYTEVIVEDRYEAYVLFLPDGSDTIWVPLRRVEWTWSARVLRSETEWIPDSSSTPEPTGESWTEHPEWDGNSADIEWQDEDEGEDGGEE